MVTTQINSMGFSQPVQNVSEKSDGTAFLKALRQEIASSVQTQQTTNISEENASADAPSPELAEKLTALFEGLAEESGSEKASLLGSLAAMLGGGNEEELSEAEEAVLEMIMQLLGQIPAAEQTQTSAETAETLPIQAADSTADYSFSVKIVAVGENSFTAASGGVSDSTESGTEGAAAQYTAAAADEAYSYEIPVEKALFAEYIISGTEQNTESVAVIQQLDSTSETAPIQTNAREILDTLLQYAKENLGLSQADIKAKTAPLETEQPVFVSAFFIPSPGLSMKTGNSELEQLLSGVEAPADENPEAQANIPLTTEIPKEQEAKADTEAKPSAEIFTAEIGTAASEALVKLETAEIKVPLAAQLSEKIISQLQTSENGKSTFTMTLNPETLGKIDVKITSEAGKVAVEITAHSSQTQSVLSERAEAVREVLKQSGVELEKFQVVYSPEKPQTEHRSYDGSSKNPYSDSSESESEKDEETDEFAQLLESL